jgi:hypothetical protein
MNNTLDIKETNQQIDKLLNLLAKMVKEYKILKSNLKATTIQEKIDEINNDIDILDKDFRNIKSKLSDLFILISEQAKELVIIFKEKKAQLELYKEELQTLAIDSQRYKDIQDIIYKTEIEIVEMNLITLQFQNSIKKSQKYT